MKYNTNNNFRGQLLVWMLDLLIPIHTSFYRNRKAWGITREQMLQYGEGTLGNRIGQFLLERDLHSIPKAERHDVYHILLSFGTDPENEAAMQFFLLGNGKRSPVCFGVSIISGMLLPEYWGYFKRQYQRGKTALNIGEWDFKDLLSANFEELHNYVFNHTMPSKALAHQLQEIGYSKKI